MHNKKIGIPDGWVIQRYPGIKFLHLITEVYTLILYSCVHMNVQNMLLMSHSLKLVCCWTVQLDLGTALMLGTSVTI